MDTKLLIGTTIGNLTITEYLGGGIIGNAFKTDLNTVLKFTTYPNEFMCVSEILKGNLSVLKPYLCEFYGMQRLIQDDIDFDGYVIHKEYLLYVGNVHIQHPVYKWIGSLPKDMFNMLGVWDCDVTRNIGVNTNGEYKAFDPMFWRNCFTNEYKTFNNLNCGMENLQFINPYSDEVLDVIYPLV